LSDTDHIYHNYYRALNYYLSGNETNAKKVLQSIIDQNKKGVFSQFSRALHAAIINNNQEAKDIVLTIIDKRKKQNHQDGEFTYKQAQIFAIAGELELAISNLQLSVSQGFFPANYFKTDPALVSIRHDVRFKDIIKSTIQRHRAFAIQFNLPKEI
jgi:hypothetical protein